MPMPSASRRHDPPLPRRRQLAHALRCAATLAVSGCLRNPRVARRVGGRRLRLANAINPELVLTVPDGFGLNQRFWVFYSAAPTSG